MYNKATVNRLHKEAKQCAANNSREIEIFPFVDGDIYKWRAVLTPPEGSIFYKRRFELEITIPPRYPYFPPLIRFLNPPNHHYIYMDGLICISSMSNDWSPALAIHKLLIGVLSLLNEPSAIDAMVMSVTSALGPRNSLMSHRDDYNSEDISSTKDNNKK